MQNTIEEQVIAVHVSGASITDSNKNIYYDLEKSNLGYNIPPIIKSLELQIEKVALSNRILVSEPLAVLSKKLANFTPGNLEVSYLCNSSDEAIDSAFKLVKGRYPNKSKIAVVKGSNTGCFSNGLKLKEIGEKYLSAFQLELVSLEPNNLVDAKTKLNNEIAALFFDPIIKRDGLIELTSEYTKLLENQCKENGIVLIVNEKWTMGNTSPSYNFPKMGINPDVVILGDVLNGNTCPFGAYITTQELNNKVYDRKNPTLHGSTTAANPPSCVVASTVIDLMQKSAYTEKFNNSAWLLKRIFNLFLSEDIGLIESKIIGTTGVLVFEDTKACQKMAKLFKDELIIVEVSNLAIYLKIPTYLQENEDALIFERFSTIPKKYIV